MVTPELHRDYFVDPEKDVALRAGSRFTLEECEAAEDARLRRVRVVHDPEDGAVSVGGHGYKRRGR